MANFHAIESVCTTLLRLMEAQCPRDEFVGRPVFRLLHCSDFAEPITEGISISLYRVAVNAASRQQTSRQLLDERQLHPALLVDLHLLIAPWAIEPAQQMRLLGWVMHFIEHHPLLTAAQLNAAPSASEPPVFNPDETVKLQWETLSVADYFGLWERHGPNLQTSVTCCASAVPLSSSTHARS